MQPKKATKLRKMFNLKEQFYKNNNLEMPKYEGCYCKKTWLVLDDEIINLIVIDFLLQSNDLDCVWVGNGEDGLDFIQCDREKTCCKDYVNYVITDLSMPILDGFQFSKQALEFISDINKHKRKTGEPEDWLKIFALTGH